jgi:hypothetical protein
MIQSGAAFAMRRSKIFYAIEFVVVIFMSQSASMLHVFRVGTLGWRRLWSAQPVGTARGRIRYFHLISKIRRRSKRI